MKLHLKIISPILTESLSSEFTIEHKSSKLSVMGLIQKLKDSNPDLYKEIREENSINSNYICIINNELLLNGEKDSCILNEGDKVVISYVIGGG